MEVSSNFTLQPFYPQGNSSLYPLVRRIGVGPITGMVTAEKRKSVALPGIEPQFLGL
jgi:hypothetical protein